MFAIIWFFGIPFSDIDFAIFSGKCDRIAVSTMRCFYILDLMKSNYDEGYSMNSYGKKATNNPIEYGNKMRAAKATPPHSQ